MVNLILVNQLTKVHRPKRPDFMKTFYAMPSSVTTRIMIKSPEKLSDLYSTCTMYMLYLVSGLIVASSPGILGEATCMSIGI